MTVKKDLFLSILSMDSYNRGYNPGIAGLGGIDTQICSATIKKESDTAPSTPGVTAGFYGISYKLDAAVDTIDNGTTIISYRGTNGGLREVWNVDLPLSYTGSER